MCVTYVWSPIVWSPIVRVTADNGFLCLTGCAIASLHGNAEHLVDRPLGTGHVEKSDDVTRLCKLRFLPTAAGHIIHAADAANDRFQEQPKPGGFPRRARRGRPPSVQNGISSSRQASSGFSLSADFGRLRKSTFSAMISQP